MKLMHDLVGETLSNRYRLVARVAGGGMGDVYRGHDLLLDRGVAVKVLQSSLASDPELVGRFKAEARAAARLTHPNVVAVYDWGSEDDTYYMVMEYVPGTDLRDVLVTRGAVPFEQAVEIVIGVCDALTAAHEGSLVHRDVKPENVLIARSGTVKVADFGIAAVADIDRTAPSGAIPGTLRYLSPEQASGREATFASDLWAAGALLSELVTGSPPSRGTGADLLRRRASEQPVPPSALTPKVPHRVDAVVLKACALDPADRFESSAEMAAALRRAAAELPTPAPLDELLEEITGEVRLPDTHPTELAPRDVRRMRRRRKRMAAVGLAIAFLALGAARGVAALLAPDLVDVPSVVGLTQKRASAAARAAGLTIEVRTKKADLFADEGTIIRQSPADGSIVEGSPVSVVISTGPPPMTVPDVTGLPLDIAAVRLRSHELVVGKTTPRFSSQPEGTVVAQGVEGRAPWGTEVPLVISKGPRSIGIPDVIKMDVEEARRELKAAGFAVTVTSVYSDTVGEGKVVATVPGAGTMAPEGSTVEIQRSMGPEFEPVVVPDVRNMSVGEARERLLSLGLRVDVRDFDGCGANGTVADTDPLPGEKVRENDLVALFIVC